MLSFRGRFVSASAFVSALFLAPHADANLLTNPSFELGTFVNDGNGTMVLNLGSTTMTGWTVSADQLAWIISPNPWGLSAQDGNRFLDLTAYLTGAPFGAVTQNVATVPGQQYDLSFYLGSFTTRWGGPPVSITASAGGTSRTFTQSTPTTSSTWTQFTLPFTATSTTTPITLAGAAGVEYIGLDSVSVDASGTVGAVPEPASWLSILSGAGMLAAAWRRRRAS